MIETKKSFCRFCHIYCGIEVDVDTEKNRIVALRPDKEHPMSEGYTCMKGRAELERLYHSDRVLSPQKRIDGRLVDISPSQAFDEIAAKLKAIIDQYGPHAVGMYVGLSSIMLSGSGPWLARKWMDAIGSRSFFTSYSIDCPNLTIAPYRFWGAPMPLGSFDMPNADVAMIIGANPLISHLPFTPQPNPLKRLRDALKRGMKLIVIDPRRSNVAKLADIHVQVKPGEDATLLAAMIKVIIDEGLYDNEYVNQLASGFDSLREAVQDFDLDYASLRTQVPSDTIRSAAVLFAQGPKGAASQGIGLHMSRHPNLTTHLVMTLNGICGRYDRIGGIVNKPLLLAPPLPENPQPIDMPLFTGLVSRVREIKAFYNWLGAEEIPASCLTDEILKPGEGQVRALIVFVGNPVLSFPDELSTVRAMKNLDLLVVNDLFVSATAQYAHYVFGLKHPFEQVDIPRTMDFYYPVPFMQYTKPLVDAPPGVLEGYEPFWELAKRLGVSIDIPGISMDKKPTGDGMLDAFLRDAQIPMDEIRKYSGGHIWGEWKPQAGLILPSMIGHPDKRMALGHPEVMAELREVRAEPVTGTSGYDIGEACAFRLVNYRMPEVYSTVGQNVPSLHQRAPYNPVLINKKDMESLGIKDGDRVLLENRFGSVEAIAEATEDLNPGVIGMAYGWGDPADPRDIREKGSSVQRIIPDDYRFDPVTGIALMTAIPVNVIALPEKQ